MKFRRVILPSLGLAAATVIGLGVASQTQAFGNRDGSEHETLIQRIAERFNLNQDEVEEVFGEVRTERQAERQAAMQEEFSQKLDEAVTKGTLTEEQKQAILAKHEELLAKKQELKNLEPEARREAMKVLHEEMGSWAEANDINWETLGFGPGMGRKSGNAMRKHFQ